MTECVYVAAGAAGLLKVGKTRNAQDRKRGLAQEFKRRGDELVKFHACGALPHAYGAERDLIDAVATRVPRVSGREWFLHGNFAHAVRAAEELTEHWAAQLKDWKPYVPLPPEEAARRAALRERERQVARERRAAFEAGLKLRRRLRAAGQYAIEGMVMALAPAIPEPAKAA